MHRVLMYFVVGFVLQWIHWDSDDQRFAELMPLQVVHWRNADVFVDMVLFTNKKVILRKFSWQDKCGNARQILNEFCSRKCPVTFTLRMQTGTPHFQQPICLRFEIWKRLCRTTCVHFGVRVLLQCLPQFNSLSIFVQHEFWYFP